MGLREQKAAATRRGLVDAALELFFDVGYDETTMESIAERAGVGTSTLYRYFPTKDLLVLDRLVASMDLAALLAARPDDEPLPRALAEALLASMREFDDPSLGLRAVRGLVDAAPVARARLWDTLDDTRQALDVEVARRRNSDPADLSVRLTVGFAMQLLQLADEVVRAAGAPPATPPILAEATMRDLLAAVPGTAFDVPRL